MDAYFTCISESTACWFYQDFNSRIGTGNTLHIPHVNNSVEGYYECHGTTADHVEFTARAMLTTLGEMFMSK